MVRSIDIEHDRRDLRVDGQSATLVGAEVVAVLDLPGRAHGIGEKFAADAHAGVLRDATDQRLAVPWTGCSELWASTDGTTYGRLGIIHCDHQPAIELLEILAPIP